MSTKKTGGPAFPVECDWSGEGLRGIQTGNQQGYATGMTLRQYAAIKLKVPDSGTDWLDKMIETSLRDDFAGNVMQGNMADHTNQCESEQPWSDFCEISADSAYEISDAMMEARKK